jgi:hypothetical protein
MTPVTRNIDGTEPTLSFLYTLSNKDEYGSNPYTKESFGMMFPGRMKLKLVYDIFDVLNSDDNDYD